MLRAAIVEKSKEHREYIRAGLQGLNMEIQVSEFSNEYDYLENGDTLESYAKLGELEESLPGKLFFRCHQSYIINLYFVEKMETGKFQLPSVDIPISRKYQREARDMYYDYMFEKM